MGRGVVDRAAGKGREVATGIDKEILNREIVPSRIIPQICCGFDWKKVPGSRELWISPRFRSKFVMPGHVPGHVHRQSLETSFSEVGSFLRLGFGSSEMSKCLS